MHSTPAEVIESAELMAAGMQRAHMSALDERAAADKGLDVLDAVISRYRLAGRGYCDVGLK